MNPWMEFANNWLLRTTLEGSLLIASVLGLSWTLGRHLGPSWRVTLWALVGLKLLIPAFLPSAPGFGAWFRPEPAAETTEIPLQAEYVPVLELTPVLAVPATLSPLTTSTLEEATAPLTLPSIGQILFSIWITGLVAFLAGLVWHQCRFVSRYGLQPDDDPRLLSLVREVAATLGVNREIKVLLGPEGTTPAVFGAWKCRLILPRDWETRFEGEVLRYLILHEMEHIRHRDVLLNWMAAAVNALHWFNPLVWVAVSRFQSDRELRCDANTLSRLKPEERFEYGRTLLRVQSEFVPAPAIAGVAPCVRNHPTLRHRILMITNPTRRKSWLNAILALGITGLIALSFGSATAEEEKAPKAPDKPVGAPPREGDRKPDPNHRPEEGKRPDGDYKPEGDRRPEGDRPGDGRGFREGDRPHPEHGRPGGPPPHREGEVRVAVLRDGVKLGDRMVRLENLRSELEKGHARSAIIFAQPDVPFHQINAVTMALRGAGVHDVRIGGIEGQPGRPPHPEGAPRDGDRPRPDGAPREGDRPRPEGAPREGDRPRPEGAPRDGDRPRPEGAPRDGDRPDPKDAPREGERPAPKDAPRGGAAPEGDKGPSA